ncbi:TetR/AcrR family transcriptional regulator [Jannaschia marina]|uniref:TetR/AcrR family transcriptional regulator n=1 Tax=Jannaschia marina TaxID=2741674 RepID=UPI0015C7AAD1|nr:TetR/AcrR family transcriptional regulator [Jannaschia marina]
MSRFRRADWLDLGLRQLGKAGFDGLTLETLCRASGRTRGSFYHHFKDMKTFVHALVEIWAERQTEAVIAKAEAAEPGARGAALQAAVGGLDQGLELAIRLAARRDPVFAAAQARVDRRRLDYLAALIAEERGLVPDTARRMAETEYAALVGSGLLFPGEAPRSLFDLRVPA